MNGGIPKPPRKVLISVIDTQVAPVLAPLIALINWTFCMRC
ncbi:Uncharacterised protein [Mycobacteroides abscessus subsp. abscessus]|nr:Uncharacterised protein [Mycobacteroides abscessus subsp. abscessus]